MRSAPPRKDRPMLADLIEAPSDAPAAVPIGRLGPFEVAFDGTLSPADPAVAPGFSYRWRGRRVAARLLPGWRVGLSVVAARVPFTAEDAEARTRVLAAVSALRDWLARDWSLRLTADHAIHLGTRADLGSPPTATRLVAAATLFALDLGPLIDFLEAEGARPA
jgi:hypothetical protein